MFSRDLIIDRIELLKGQMGQKELAEIIGCTQSKISGLLSRRGTKNFTVEELCSLADYFHVSVDYLLGRDDIKDRRSGSEEDITPRKLCETLSRAIDTAFPWTLTHIEIEEMRPMEADAFFHVEKKSVQYPAIYFSTLRPLSDPELNYQDPEDFTNWAAVQINNFLEDTVRLGIVRGHHTISNEDYSDLIEKKLSRVIDKPLMK